MGAPLLRSRLALPFYRRRYRGWILDTGWAPYIVKGGVRPYPIDLESRTARVAFCTLEKEKGVSCSSLHGWDGERPPLYPPGPWFKWSGVNDSSGLQ